MQEWMRIAGAVILPQIGGFLGGMITKNKIKTFYDKLDKPDWRPPNWLFGPVWTCLYAGMGFASYLVWRDGGGFDGAAKLPLQIYATQLLLNWTWTPIFFGMEALGLSAIWIVAVDVGVVATINSFMGINKTAAYLLLPYLAWSSFATLLNWSIWSRNSGHKKSA